MNDPRNGRILTPDQYAFIPFWTSRTDGFSLGAAPTEILPSDKRRVSFIVSSDGLNDFAMLNENTVSTTRGLVVTGTSGFREMLFRDHGTIVGEAWFAVALGAGADIVVIETLFDPGGFRRSARKQSGV